MYVPSGDPSHERNFTEFCSHKFNITEQSLKDSF